MGVKHGDIACPAYAAAPDLQYSCAYFRAPTDTLEQAEINNMVHIARIMLIEPGMSVLDIGRGWGGMALTLTRDFLYQRQEMHRAAE